ncbi:hypothetical protein OROMI_013529 [Orobanche minor]
MYQYQTILDTSLVPTLRAFSHSLNSSLLEDQAPCLHPTDSQNDPDAGKELDPLRDLNLENERKLGDLVRERFDTDFFILHRYPIGARPFFYMACHDDASYSCSFDVFIRGEEVGSGAQRVHDANMLKGRVKEAKITGGDKTLESYIESLSSWLKRERERLDSGRGRHQGMPKIRLTMIDNINRSKPNLHAHVKFCSKGGTRYPRGRKDPIVLIERLGYDITHVKLSPGKLFDKG